MRDVNSSPRHVIPVLGIAQILAWGSSYYLLAVLAAPIAADTGWAPAWIIGGLSFGLVVAGTVSPRVGDSIQRHGGRPVLALSAVFLGLGLAGLGLSPNLPTYLLSWLVIGVGMGAGLYDAAFATLGRLYGMKARSAITTLTLFGGFASTLCWPLSAWLVSEVGWRNACIGYAGIHLFLLLPLYAFALPREPRRQVCAMFDAPYMPTAVKNDEGGRDRLLLPLVAATITVSSMISAVFSVHLISILQSHEITLAEAVTLAAVVGPSQVGARIVEMIISRHHHPIWTKAASTLFVAIGVGALWAGLPLIVAALLFYGAGIGIESIARGTLPLALFGEERYAAVMGRIAMPSLIVQAAAPSIGAVLMERFGVELTLGALLLIALANLILVALLFLRIRKPTRKPITDEQA